jgi:membrane protease YdiL (CAAX protease family)
VPEFRQPPGGGGTANPGWYADPWGRSAWRWWDGWQWSGWISPPEAVGPAVIRQLVVEPTPLSQAPPEAPDRERLVGGAAAGVGPMTDIGGPPPRADHVPPAEPARPVPKPDRPHLVVELLIVLAIFPLPYVLSALQDLTGSLLGEGPGQRIPTVFPGHVAAGFPFVVLLVLLPLAAAALVLYLLSRPGDGGPKAIGLDRRHVRADLALLLPVFLLCDLIPIAGGGILLSGLGVRGVNPSLGHLPAYYDLAYVAMALVAGIVEEIVVLGYLVRRLEQLGLRPVWVVVIAVAVRGSYHLYYGWDVLPILAWATVTVLLYRRYRRLAPFIIVHILWDTGLFLIGWFTAVEAVVLTVATIVFSAMWWHYLPPRPPSGGGGNQAPEPRAWSGH